MQRDDGSVRRLSELTTQLASPAVVSVYLFGSVSEGRSHRESDLDIGLLLRWDSCPTASERFEQRVEWSAHVSAALGGRPADVVILNDAPPGLGRAIVTRGRRIYCSDPEADHAFVRDVQLRAADIEPFLRRTRQVKLNAISR